MYGETKAWMDKQRDRQTERYTNILTGRQNNTHTETDVPSD
jgi:hypothetical protein